MASYLIVAAIVVCLIGLEEGWWNVGDLFGLAAIVAFLFFMAMWEKAKEQGTRTPPASRPARGRPEEEPGGYREPFNLDDDGNDDGG